MLSPLRLHFSLLCRSPRPVFTIGSLKFLTTKKQTDSSKPVAESAYEKQNQLAFASWEKPYAAMSSSEKVVEGSKDSFYTLVIIGGIALTGCLGYIVFRELFSRETVNGIFTEALNKCRENEELKLLLGLPMAGFGEESRRGRRRLLSFTEFTIDGVKCMRMQFHVKGPKAQGLVNLEVRKNDANKYVYRYLFVETTVSRKPVIIVDNR